MQANGSESRLEHGVVRALALLSLLLVSAALLLSAIADVPFHTKGEPREALVIQTMFVQGEYAAPLRNGNEIPSKPPLFHWLGVIAAHASGGVTEAITRIPSVAAALAVIAVTTLLGFRWWGTIAGLAAGVALLTGQQFIASATTARVDMVLAATISVAVAGAGLALSEQRRLPLFAYVAAALAVLAKGPVGYVLPGAIIAVYIVARRRIPRIADLRVGPAIAIALLPLLWYLAAWWAGGQEFLDKLIFKENVYRVLDPDSVRAGHVKPIWFYGPALLGAAAPWSLCLPAVLLDAWRRRGHLDDDRTLLPLIWVGVTVALFSLSPSKRAVYLLPCFPAIALLIGHWVASGSEGREVGRTGRIAATAAAVIIAIPAGLIALQAVGIPAMGWVEPLLGSASDRSNLASLIGLADTMRTQLLAWALASWALLAFSNRCFQRGKRLPAFAGVAAMIVATVGLAGLPMQREMALRQTVRPLVERVRPTIPADEQVFFYRGLNYAIAYYLGRPVPPTEEVREGDGRNRTWYFVWEQSVDDLCSRIRALGSGSARYGCRRRDHYDFFDNPAREALVLVSSTPRRSRKGSRPGSSP